MSYENAIANQQKKLWPTKEIIFAFSMTKNLTPLALPKAPLKLAQKKGVPYVWDDIRKKYLKLTPEEWVRQHFVHFLYQKNYPKSAIALEGGFKLNTNLQRTDILIYKNAKPALIVECKAPQVKISQNTFDQAARYNLHYKVAYIVVSNGLESYFAKVDTAQKKYTFLPSMPLFNEL